MILSYASFDVNAKGKNVYYKNETEGKKIALTFDDGPHPRYTERILNILKKYDVKATFFVIGVNIENYPGVIERIDSEGHEIGNHTYSHNKENLLTDEGWREEVEKCQKLIEVTTGKTPKLLRPPGGNYKNSAEVLAREKGYSLILWSIDTMDWNHNPPNMIFKNVTQKLRGGDIILMHDYISGKNTTCDALEMIIPKLLNDGYEFVTVSELLSEN